MGAIYRLGLVIAGCYFEGAVRNASQLVLYWAGQQSALEGFLPYLIPVFFGYVFALDARSHWSGNRLKNDIIAYVGSTLLTGYPLLIALSLWFAGVEVDPTTSRIRVAATIVFFVNLGIAALVWRSAVRRGFPLSMPWGGVSKNSLGNDSSPQDLGVTVSEQVTTDEPRTQQASEEKPQAQGQ